MPILDAILAFALTMFVVATVVSQIVTIIQNFFKLRSAGFQKMISEFFDRELIPEIRQRLGSTKKNVKSEMLKTLEMFDKTHVIIENELASLVDLSTDELKMRIKRSEFGKALHSELGDLYAETLEKLGERYEAVCKKFSESFRTHSRRWATGVAFVLALAVNIDSIHVMDSYIKNQNIRQSVTGQTDFFIEEYNSLISSLDNNSVKNSITKEDLQNGFRKTRDKTVMLANSGFPVGWNCFPYSYFNKNVNSDFNSKNNPGGWIMWIFGIILTGMLAGLGAPFWYDTVAGISQIVRNIKTTEAGKK